MAEVDSGTGSELGGGTPLFKAVVVEVLYDLGYFNNEKKQELAEKLKVKNEKRLINCPLNTCIVRPFGQGAAKSDSTFVVWPMFPPHISMPVKPGECVWILSPTLSSISPKDSYWLCRISGGDNADDVNYTHWPRTFGVSTEPGEQTTSTADKAAALESSPAEAGGSGGVIRVSPQFPNKSDTGDLLKGPEGEPGNPFSLIVNSSETYKQIVKEPVPKFSKRPGDLVLQGSNNTLISLGQDRGWTYSDDSGKIKDSETSNAYNIPDTNAGSIDIVVGRSRYMPAKPMNMSQDGDDFERTNYRTVENARESVELLKDHETTGLPRNNAAGDPDLVVDSARILVSMKTNPDINFGIDTKNKRIPVGFDEKIEDVSDAACIVAKADEIRIVSRNQKEKEQYSNADQPEINGSIRIIKEGGASEDLAAICLLPDGTIQVSGSKIFLGRAPSDGGAGGGPGPGDSQPYVKYQQLEDLLNAILDDLDALAGELINNKSPGYGAPNVTVVSGGTALKAAVAQRKSEIVNIKSDRIFGE